ncbi:hypothetical protein B2_gp69 [Shigella phage B2]|nr:hypothetical protein B2_gp69 [Shigella phage B2]
MNGDLIDILELIVVLKLGNRNKVCNHIMIHRMCNDIPCSECLLNTSKVYISDYPIQIIEMKGKLNEQ